MKKIITVAAFMIAVGCSMRENPVEPGTGGTGGTDKKDSVIHKDTSIVVDTNGHIIDTSGIGVDTTGVDKGVVIVSERTEEIIFDSNGKNVSIISGVDTIAADDIRAEIKKEQMSLSLFTVSNLKVKTLPAFDTFITENKDRRVLLTVSTSLPGKAPEVAIVTPDFTSKLPIVTLGALKSGISLNKGLYVNDGNSLKSFEGKLKNPAVTDIIFNVTVQFLDGSIIVPENFKLQCTISGTSKKKV